MIPGEWNLDLIGFLKWLKKSWYTRPVSIKIDLKPTELADKEKLKRILKKVKWFYDRYFLNKENTDDEENIQK
jgi:hypothetical protein